jgi:hypothetical protein
MSTSKTQYSYGFPQYFQKSTELEFACFFVSFLSDGRPRLFPVRSGGKGGRKERHSYHIVPRLNKLWSFFITMYIFTERHLGTEKRAYV